MLNSLLRLRLLHPITVAILDAGRNALSFFLLLVVSLGLSVVRESLGRLMIRCQLLAVAHFIFGGQSENATCICHIPNTLPVLYAVGIVELELESTSAFVLLLFVIPLAFTLSGFLLWILYSLNGQSHTCPILALACTKNITSDHYPTCCKEATP